MGPISPKSWSGWTFSFLSLQLLASLNYCFCHTNKTHHQWLEAQATWYGPPTGAGTTGNSGACGYTDNVEKPPFHKLVAAGGDAFYKSGKGCGGCYKVKCKSHPDCSKRPVNIVITDHCPGTNQHFDLSGHAFGAMARPGKEEVLVEFVEGDGTVCSVELRAANSNGTWVQMKPSWGALWQHSCSSPLCGPISFRITTDETKRVVTVNDVLPEDWKPGQDYRATHH
ncbi:unnamed protein product [Linum tenue]|uniref:Uncharacterized protein n=1 Tax=Linum tenue TaxID=586396 RepID=A0AAV0KZH9_9ROSI|nr:unnamed protein product [Linum tenue]CAI0427007.1 unnamed protein product [Linum tenue]